LATLIWPATRVVAPVAVGGAGCAALAPSEKMATAKAQNTSRRLGNFMGEVNV
jgi:hypothetical protein